MPRENRNDNPNGLEEEKLEFLKREEIRTMQKDIARLREFEAQKERGRVQVLEAEEKIKIPPTPPPEKPKEEIPRVEKIPLDTLIPKPPRKRPSPLTKLLVRGLIVIFCFLFLGFFYWFLEIRKPVKEVAPPAEEEVLPPVAEIEEKPEIIVPPPLIQVKETKISEISKIEEIPQVFKQLMKEELTEGSLTRVAIKNLTENRLASLEDLSSAFEIEIPEEIFSKLDPDFTLSIFKQKQGKRLVLVGKVKEKEGLNEILKNWEAKIKKEGISLSGKKIPALVSYFRQGSYKGVTYRYLTISKEDLGICYALFSDYFILTSSWESIVKTIDLLIIPPAGEIPPEEEITPPIEEIPSEEEVLPGEVIQAPSIQERILDWGYYIPTAARTIDTIIIHSAYDALGKDPYSVEGVIYEYKLYKVAAHYLIARDGSIYRLAPDEAIAYHAGVSRMPDGSRVNIINNFSIGIELIYTKTESPNEGQYQALSQLVKYLRQQYNIPSENILGHNQIAPERKDDPWNFDWEYFKPLLE